ncbi:MAG: bile acid:sodium symporter [Bacteroidales bacterium]|nr:bile acid:sodium symporter [Bacteroidales bacterium]
MLKFLKNWALPLAMLAGVAGYFLLACLPVFDSVRPCVGEAVSRVMPVLIFAQLLLTFCKVDPRELVPVRWHGWLLLVQLCLGAVVSLVVVALPPGSPLKALGEGALVCFVCPTATAAAVVTAKLGGSASTLSTYTLLSNLLAAVFVPLVFPIVEPHAQLSFPDAFLKILGKVFPLLLSPFVVALLLRWFVKPLHRCLASHSGFAFHIWAVALTLVMGQTTRSMVRSDVSFVLGLSIAIGGLFACAVQFVLGKAIGGACHDRISAGQALGQKNTVLAIWMAVAYLSPAASIGPGSYVVWQNVVNSWQLWRRRTKKR